MVGNINKKNQLISFIIIVLLIFANNYIPKYIDNNINLSKSVEELVQNIEIEKDEDIFYRRAEWGSVSLSFISQINGKRESLKRYSIDLSEHTIDPNEESFKFLDPCSGELIEEIMEVEFDHIIPLNYVAMHNGDNWTQKEKDDYAYALDAGIPCSKSENRFKSDKGPSKYLPKINQEEYCFTWLVIANKYNISLTQEDLNKIKKVLKDTEDVNILNKYNKIIY